MNIARMSVLQLAVVGEVGSGGLAAGSGHLPAVRALVEVGGAARGEPDHGVPHVDARRRRRPPSRKLECEDRPRARLLLLLLELAPGLVAKLRARARAVPALERGLEAVGDGRGVGSAV